MSHHQGKYYRIDGIDVANLSNCYTLKTIRGEFEHLLIFALCDIHDTFSKGFQTLKIRYSEIYCLGVRNGKRNQGSYWQEWWGDLLFMGMQSVSMCDSSLFLLIGKSKAQNFINVYGIIKTVSHALGLYSL